MRGCIPKNINTTKGNLLFRINWRQFQGKLVQKSGGDAFKKSHNLNNMDIGNANHLTGRRKDEKNSRILKYWIIVADF